MPDLSREIRHFPPADPGPNPIHIGVACPSAYPVALASLGYQTIHLLAHSHPGFVTHRIVLNKADGTVYPSRTLEEGLRINSLAALLFSCSFELDYLHLVRILDEAGIPILRRDRGSTPLVIIGGIAPTANPEPTAMIADAISIGEGEETLPGVLDDIQGAFPLLQGPRFLEARQRLYELWDSRDGVYVPALWEDEKGGFFERNGRRLVQASVSDPDRHPSYTPVVSPEGVYGAKNLVAISSGCPAGCRFCLLSYVFPPGPHRSVESILENAGHFSPDEASVGLVSSRVSDHPHLARVINALTDDGFEVSVSSLRIAGTTTDILDALARSGSKTVTFAPEHGSARIRDLFCKPHTYEEIRDRVVRAYDAGISRVKLYFLTGFVEETAEDLDATPDFVLSLASDARLASRPAECRLTVGLAPFVPKAATPFQRRPMDDEKTLRRKMKRITDPLKRRPRIEVEIESPRSAIMQGALSQGDRTIAAHLAEIARTRGALVRSWDEALRKAGDGPRRRVLESRDESAALPWSFIKRPKSGNDP